MSQRVIHHIFHRVGQIEGVQTVNFFIYQINAG